MQWWLSGLVDLYAWYIDVSVVCTLHLSIFIIVEKYYIMKSGVYAICWIFLAYIIFVRLIALPLILYLALHVFSRLLALWVTGSLTCSV